MKHVYQTYMEIAGEEFPCEIEGTYFPAQRAYTPRGEYAPIDPPEPEAFEIDEIRVQVRQTPTASPEWISFPTKLLTLKQLETLMDEACADAVERFAEARAFARARDDE
jgi:hypothetical protein